MSRDISASKDVRLAKERDLYKEAQTRCVKAQAERERTHEFIKIPIFKGYRLQEVKTKSNQ